MSDLVGNPEDRFSRVAAHMSWAVVGKTVDIYCYIACALFLVIGLILALQRITN